MNGLCLVVSVVWALAAAGVGDVKPSPETGKGPRISVEPASFDFGKVVQNRTLTKDFVVRNFGTEDLVLEGVSTTCGCTVASGYSKVVKPGGSTQLRVALETRTYSGHLERKVLVRSNDRTKALTEIKVEATIVSQP